MGTKKISILLYLLLLISFSTSVYLVFDKITNQYQNIGRSLVTTKVKAAAINETSLWNNIHESIISSGIIIPDGILIESSSNDTFFVKNNYPTLIFYIPHENCSVCIEDELKDLKARFPKEFVNGSNIIILREIENLRYWKVLENQINHAIYKPIDGLNKIPLYKRQIPFYFILDNNNFVSEIFIPDKNQAQLKTDYFNLVARIFKNK